MTVQDDAKQKQFKKFQKLDESWRSEWLGRQTEEVYKEITRIAINDVQLAMAKEFDDDLKQLKEQVKEAGAIYSDGKKLNHNQISFLVECLKSRGQDVPSIDDFIKAAANTLNGNSEQ
jgi:hypothetical protein